MTWKINETNQLDAQAVDRLGNKFLLGNGYLGYRGTLEEYDQEQKTATIVSGLYDKVGDLWREPINMPNGGYVRLSYRGAPLHALTSKVERHSQTLDMQHGVHERETVFLTADGNAVTVRSRRIVSLAAHHLICCEYTIKAARACTLEVSSGIDGDVWDINGPHLEALATAAADGVISLAARTHEKRVPVAVAEVLIDADGADAAGPTSDEVVRREEKRILREFSLTLAANRPRTLVKIVAHHTGLDAADPLTAARASAAEGAKVGFASLLAAHKAAWETRWRACDIQIDGDNEAQTALRFSMYHLLAIAPTHAENVSIPARGLSGQVYKGGIFWDTEIFMLPFFSHAFPSIARNLLLYRYHTLEGARRKAREYGFRGAFFAWESQDDGEDACTLFNVTDVFTNRPMRTYFRDKQYHISADVVYAIWDYYSITGDSSIFADGCAEVIYECARFFLTLAYYNHDKTRYEILDVTGPDEYHERVNNNAYTNWMAAHTFDVCVKVADYLAEQQPAVAAELLERLCFAEDLETIREMARLLYRPAPDPDTSVIPQFDGYFGLEDVALNDLLARKLHPHEYLGGGNGIATTTQIIKQADVILGLFLFQSHYSTEIRRANWEFYEPRTEHGSSLSACSYSLIAAQIGKIDWAYDYFMMTASIDLTGDSKQYVGPLYIGGTHPAANGGAWMSAVIGLCGIDCADETIAINPQLPKHWKSVSLPLAVRGTELRLTLTNHRVTVQATTPSSGTITVRSGGQAHVLPQTGILTIALGGEETKVEPSGNVATLLPTPEAEGV
jgi:nigerose phosphorylase